MIDLQLAEGALDRVIAEFDRLGKPHYHMIGNHDLYNIPRSVGPLPLPGFSTTMSPPFPAKFNTNEQSS